MITAMVFFVGLGVVGQAVPAPGQDGPDGCFAAGFSVVQTVDDCAASCELSCDICCEICRECCGEEPGTGDDGCVICCQDCCPEKAAAVGGAVQSVCASGPPVCERASLDCAGPKASSRSPLLVF